MKKSIGMAVFFWVLFGCATSKGPDFFRQKPEERAISEAYGSQWIVSTQGRAASSAVKEVFEKGGNIIDAAVAASFAISVERPQSTGLGGGGFLLYREAKSGKVWAIDFRERAPLSAYEKMYLNEKGEVIEDKSLVGVYAIGVPGVVRGLSEIHKKFGKMSFSKLVDPAIRLAEEGLVVYPYLANALDEEQKTLGKFAQTKSIFLKADGKPYLLGEKIIQKDLAASLRKVAKTYGEDFYSGSIARAIVKSSDGKISMKDLKNYRVKWREPVRGTFKGYEIVSMPPPSSGGTHVIEILNLLEKENLSTRGFQSKEGLLTIAKAMRFAFIDRARYMGDPDFVKVPKNTLTSKAYAESIRASEAWKMDRADADSIAAKWPVLPESSDTTHFSIMDVEGNTVVSTQTINGWFGSAVVAEGTGILLNNEMDDFSAKPGASNLFGAIGSAANAVTPGKTPLSSMSPTIVLKDSKPVLALGAPGGTRIITCVANVILNSIEYGLPLYDSVAALRIHQQWKPDELKMEEGFDPAKVKAMESVGWKVKSGSPGCAIMAVAFEGSRLHGVSEPRDFGQAIGK